VLAIQFDKAVLKDKQEMPLNVTIQAIAAPQQQAPSSAYGGSSAGGAAPGTSSPGTSPSNNPSMSGSRGARPEGTPTTDPYPSASSNGAPGGDPNSGGTVAVEHARRVRT